MPKTLMLPGITGYDAERAVLQMDILKRSWLCPSVPTYVDAIDGVIPIPVYLDPNR